MEDSITHTRRALLLALGGGTAISLCANPTGANENENTELEIHENIDAEESDNEEQGKDQPVDQSYPVPECKVIRPTNQGRQKMPKQS